MRINNSTVELVAPSSFTISGTSQLNQLLVNETTIYQKGKDFFADFLAKMKKAGHDITDAIKAVDNGGFQPEDRFMMPTVNDNIMTETIRPVMIEEPNSPVTIQSIIQPVEAKPVTIEMPMETTPVEPVISAPAVAEPTTEKVSLAQYLEAHEIIKMYNKQQAEEFAALQNKTAVLQASIDAHREAISGIASVVQTQVEPVIQSEPIITMQRVME